MTIWRDAPDTTNRSDNYRIYRTPVGREVELICLSGNYLGASLHYWKGRSTPCIGAGCEACKSGQRPRWKGYVQAYHPATRTIVIFEFTERGYEPMQEAINHHGHLRGLKFRACRLNRKANGPIQLAFSELREESPHLPVGGDLAAMLERIWEVRQQCFDIPAQITQNTTAASRVTNGSVTVSTDPPNGRRA